MLSRRIIETIKPVLGLTLTADVTAGVASKPICMGTYQKVVFLLAIKPSSSTTGRVTVTVEACDDTVPTNQTALDFSVYKNELAGTADDFGARVDCVAATGFATPANVTALYAVEVRADKLVASGYSFVRLKCAQLVSDAMNGCIIALAGGGPEGDPDTMKTAIAS